MAFMTNNNKMEQKQYDYMFKLILVGVSSVGKSNILLRYTRNEFSEESQATIGVEYASKLIETAKGKRIKFQIWDTAGQERYRSLMKTYYKGASAALIVYDITRADSFMGLENQQRLIKEYIKGDIITMIVGNKSDMEDKRKVSKQQGLEYAESKKLAFYEVSAKEGTNIELIFTRIAEELEKLMEQPAPQLTEEEANLANNQNKTIKLTDQQKDRTGNDKKKCCK